MAGALEPVRRWLEARKMSAIDVPIWLIGLAVAVVWFAPFVWMVSTSLKYPEDVMTQDIEWLPRRVTLAASEQSRVHGDERRRERALPEQVLQEIGDSEGGAKRVGGERAAQVMGEGAFANQPRYATQ